jgi:hypothetical protein
MDNAKPHRLKKLIEKADEMGFVLVTYPPDIAPSDFFLFGYLKEGLAGTSFPDGETLISVVHQIVTTIPVAMLCRVFDDWIRRLHACVTRAGEYVSSIKKEISKIFNIRQNVPNRTDFWTTLYVTPVDRNVRNFVDE